MSRILFISGSLGLGHIMRDIEIANQLRKNNPDIQIDWIAAPPATTKLVEENENLLPVSEQFANENKVAESMAKNGQLNLADYIYNSQKLWKTNVELFKKITHETRYDLVIGDETYDLFAAIHDNLSIKNAPFVMIFDFVGMDSTTKNLFEKIICYYFNYKWSREYYVSHMELSLFIGEPEDVPDRSFGFLLPDRRAYAEKRLSFVGYIVPFNPGEYMNTSKLKEELGYTQKPLILCTVGGTSVGKELLELCSEAYKDLKLKKDIQMVIVAGPRIDKNKLKVDPDIKVCGYVPNLFKHMAASDVVITQGGGGTTLEVAALQKPFIYFPVEGHFEQEVHVAGRLMRHKVGVKMRLSETTPQDLSDHVLSLFGTKPESSLPVDGAEKAAQLINSLLDQRQT